MKNNTPVSIPAEKLHPFEGHPFKVLDNEEMNSLIESIQELGILSPLIVRPKENTADEYEIVSGHRRFRAAVKAGMVFIPAFTAARNRRCPDTLSYSSAVFSFGLTIRGLRIPKS